ncbi:SDR family oxidoreductase [Microbacterium sp. ASV49]|uniref:NAD(P)H-binding protein n=1 Tax=Microbacterium candidum TaxID=3041922 RepID=A0ABT7MYB8_9MICO|nr:NAD(P)H-binding protein [Microbacterium sp. ASV49]MDL9979452.1 NAD(P)H-binding protein [Microbacterium sp. ASV49]
MITVAGGTGRLGSLVAAGLLERGERVRVVARRARQLPDGAEFVSADLRDPSSVAAAVAGSRVVVSAINGLDPQAGESPAEVDRDANLLLTAAARDAGADLVLVSIIGARPGSPIEVAAMKHAAERATREAAGLDWTIVRSALFAELWRDILRQTAARSRRPVVFGRGENPINVVSVADVAQVVVRAALDRDLRGRVIEIGGPRNVTMNELARWATGSERPRHIPRGVLRASAVAMAPVRPAIARLMRQSLAMDTADLTYDASAARAEFAWLPCHDVVGQAVSTRTP